MASTEEKVENYRITILILVVIIAVSVLATFLVLQHKKSQDLQESPAGQSLRAEGYAPYTDLNGAEVSLEEYLGETLIVHSWASWCPQCVSQLQLFADIVNDKPDTKLLAINRAEDKVTVERYLNHYNLHSNVTLILDPDDYFYNNIGGYAMPETVVFDSEGKVIKIFRGVVTREALEEVLAQ